jgi:hypothetical protein
METAAITSTLGHATTNTDAINNERHNEEIYQ